MNARRALALILFALPFLLWAQSALADGAPSEGAEVQVRRYALILGVNDGGPDRVQLRYAGTDAMALGRVMNQLGGVHPDDAVVLLDVDRQGLSDGLARLRSLLASAEEGVRTELFFYYSGHSDEQGLLLGGERIGYSDLRDELHALPADVRIGVLDSCASGAFTRLKGGVRRTPFLVDDTGVHSPTGAPLPLLDLATDMGYEAAFCATQQHADCGLVTPGKNKLKLRPSTRARADTAGRGPDDGRPRSPRHEISPLAGGSWTRPAVQQLCARRGGTGRSRI